MVRIVYHLGRYGQSGDKGGAITEPASWPGGRNQVTWQSNMPPRTGLGRDSDPGGPRDVRPDQMMEVS